MFVERDHQQLQSLFLYKVGRWATGEAERSLVTSFLRKLTHAHSTNTIRARSHGITCHVSYTLVLWILSCGSRGVWGKTVISLGQTVAGTTSSPADEYVDTVDILFCCCGGGLVGSMNLLSINPQSHRSFQRPFGPAPCSLAAGLHRHTACSSRQGRHQQQHCNLSSSRLRSTLLLQHSQFLGVRQHH